MRQKQPCSTLLSALVPVGSLWSPCSFFSFSEHVIESPQFLGAFEWKKVFLMGRLVQQIKSKPDSDPHVFCGAKSLDRSKMFNHVFLIALGTRLCVHVKHIYFIFIISSHKTFLHVPQFILRLFHFLIFSIFRNKTILILIKNGENHS